MQARQELHVFIEIETGIESANTPFQLFSTNLRKIVDRWKIRSYMKRMP
jgi:hypothetical protein